MMTPEARKGKGTSLEVAEKLDVAVDFPFAPTINQLQWLRELATGSTTSLSLRPQSISP